MIGPEGDRCVHELVDASGVTQPMGFQHLRVLRGARLVAGTRRGREIACRLVDTTWTASRSTPCATPPSPPARPARRRPTRRQR